MHQNGLIEIYFSPFVTPQFVH